MKPSFLLALTFGVVLAFTQGGNAKKLAKRGADGAASCAVGTYWNSVNSTCDNCNENCLKGCTGAGSHLGRGGCNQCARAVVAKRGESVEVEDNSVRVSHWCVKEQESCDAGHFAIKPLGKTASSLICAPCHQEGCFACEDFTRCTLCEYARKLSKVPDAIAASLSAPAAARSLLDTVPTGEASASNEEGKCVAACKRGYWLHAAPRLTREQVAALNESERLGWFCRAQAAGEPATAEVANECRRDDDLCLPCDSLCGDAGCSGFGASNCKSCRVARLYTDDERTKFVCVSSCPAEKPYVSMNAALGDHECSAEPANELKEAFTAADADANGGLSLDEAIAFTGRFGCATQLKHEAPVVPVVKAARRR